MGVTGQTRGPSADLPSRLRWLRRETEVPIAVGFGISTPNQIRGLRRLAEGAIVGSALVKRLENSGEQHFDKTVVES